MGSGSGSGRHSSSKGKGIQTASGHSSRHSDPPSNPRSDPPSNPRSDPPSSRHSDHQSGYEGSGYGSSDRSRNPNDIAGVTYSTFRGYAPEAKYYPPPPAPSHSKHSKEKVFKPTRTQEVLKYCAQPMIKESGRNNKIGLRHYDPNNKSLKTITTALGLRPFKKRSKKHDQEYSHGERYGDDQAGPSTSYHGPQNQQTAELYRYYEGVRAAESRMAADAAQYAQAHGGYQAPPYYPPGHMFYPYQYQEPPSDGGYRQ